MIKFISVISVPLIIFIIILMAIMEKKDVLGLFSKGALDGMKIMVKIFPNILAIMIAINLFKDSGAMDIFFKPIGRLLLKFNIPQEIITLAALRPISGGASSAIVMDIFSKSGPDSIQGKIASILMGGTETTFYVIAVLYGTLGIKKNRGTLIAAILADITAIVLSIYIVLKGFI